MIGAAIIGSFVAALFFILLTALISIGIFSTSVAVGLYKRSAAVGFKMLLVIVLGIFCAICGLVLSLAVRHFYSAYLSAHAAKTAGLIAGACGGIVMGLSLFTIIQTLFQKISKRENSQA